MNTACLKLVTSRVSPKEKVEREVYRSTEA